MVYTYTKDLVLALLSQENGGLWRHHMWHVWCIRGLKVLGGDVRMFTSRTDRGGKHLNIASLIIYLWWRSAEAFGEEPAQTSRAHFITVAGNAWEIALLSCFRCMGNCTFFLCSCFICSLISPTHIHIRAYYVYFSFYCNGAVKWLGWFKSNCCIVVPTLCCCLMDRIYKLREWPLTSYMRLVIHLNKKLHISIELLMTLHNDHLHVCIRLGLRWRLIHP